MTGMENLQRSNLHVFKDIIWLDLNRWNADMELGTQHIPAANRSFATNQPSLMVDSKVVIALGKCVFIWNEYWPANTIRNFLYNYGTTNLTFRRYRLGQKATVVCDEGYEIRGRLGGAGAKLECKEDGSWESPVSSKHSKLFPFCKG